jgi:hypothetical protein
MLRHHIAPKCGQEITMGAFNGLREFASRVAEARRRRVTRRVVDALPAHLRKDIGWPNAS